MAETTDNVGKDESLINALEAELEAELYDRALSGNEVAELFLRKAGRWPKP